MSKSLRAELFPVYFL